MKVKAECSIMWFSDKDNDINCMSDNCRQISTLQLLYNKRKLLIGKNFSSGPIFCLSTANRGQWADNSHHNRNAQHVFSSCGSQTCSAHTLDYLGNQARTETASANASLFPREANALMQTLSTNSGKC